MSEKAKAGKLQSSRGLGYLTVLLLVAAALVIGAAHNPLKQFLQAILSIPTPISADTPLPTSNPISAVGTSSTDDIDIESIVYEQTDIEVLTVTVADNIRIEYLLVPYERSQTLEVHSRNMLAMICAIREVGPTRRAIIFAGVGRFIDEVDKPVLRSRVETKLSTLAFNLFECSSVSAAADVDWNAVSDYHRTFSIPERLIDSD